MKDGQELLCYNLDMSRENISQTGSMGPNLREQMLEELGEDADWAPQTPMAPKLKRLGDAAQELLDDFYEAEYGPRPDAVQPNQEDRAVK